MNKRKVEQIIFCCNNITKEYVPTQANVTVEIIMTICRAVACVQFEEATVEQN